MTAVDEHGLVRLACAAMGTRFELVLHGRDPVHLRAAGEAALDEVLLWHARLSAFESSSVVSAINRSAGAWCRVDSETFGLLELCRGMWEATRGAFDPTVGRLMRAWGMREVEYDAAEVERAMGATGMQFVELNEGRGVRLLHPGVRLDLGAIGKGWALDRARGVLVYAGVEHALMHGGTSSVMAMGMAPAGDEWKVAIGDKAGSPVVALRGATLGVSAHAGRVVQAAGVGRGHVIDPVTGQAGVLDGARGQMAAVMAESASVADALSTALLIRPELLEEVTHSVEGVRWAALHEDGAAVSRWRIAAADKAACGARELMHV